MYYWHIQEQEKQRSADRKKEEVEKKNLERKKEEVDEVQKLHVKLKQEQQRWDKECVAREKQQVRLASLTLLRISSCPLLVIVTFPLVHANQQLIKWGDKPASK